MPDHSIQKRRPSCGSSCGKLRAVNSRVGHSDLFLRPHCWILIYLKPKIRIQKIQECFTLTIMKILVTLIDMKRPHVMAKPKEERPKQNRAKCFGKRSKNKPAKIWKL